MKCFNSPNNITLVKKSLLAMVGLLLLPAIALAEMPSWWPGSNEEATSTEQTIATPATQPPTAAAEPMVDSPLFDMSWPKIEMPKINWKPAWGSDEPKGAVAKKDNPISGALDKVASASKGAAEGVRNAWGSALDRLTPGGKPSSGTRVATKEEPGFWSRMFGPQPEPEGSQTVTEFLAQERPGTTTR